MARLLLGIDIGTTSTKAILLDPGQGIVAKASAPVRLHSPHVGWAEADPAQWRANLGVVTAALLAAAGCAASDIAGIAISGMVPAVLPLDTGGRPLRRAMLQNDARAVDEIAAVAAETAGLDLLALTGSALTQQSVAPTLRWLAAREPAVAAATATACGSYDYVLHALGARRHVEQNWAMESGLFTLEGQLIDAVVSAGRLPAGIVPPVLAPGEAAGELAPGPAAELGLPAGVPLVVGGADHVLSAYAAGLNQPGDWLVKLGGGGDILVVADKPVVDQRLYLDAHPQPDLWLPNGCMATSGSLVRWLADLTGTTDLAALGEVAATRPPGEVLCLPYFLGEKSPLHDPNLRGAFVGLDLAHDAATLFRAVLEAVAFGFRHHVEVLADRGIELSERPLVSNGGSGSPIWKQIHADVLGRALVPVTGHPGASLGAAVAAGIGTGLIRDWDAGTGFVTHGEPVPPDAARTAWYDERYALWRQLGAALIPFSHALARRTT